MKHKNSDADRDRTVSHIKRRPVVVADIKIQKIYDLSEPNSID